MAKIIDFPAKEKPVRIQIDVSEQEENLYSCFWFESKSHPEVKEWLIWIHAKTLDMIPALLERAQRYHKLGQEVRRAAL